MHLLPKFLLHQVVIEAFNTPIVLLATHVDSVGDISNESHQSNDVLPSYFGVVPLIVELVAVAVQLVFQDLLEVRSYGLESQFSLDLGILSCNFQDERIGVGSDHIIVVINLLTDSDVLIAGSELRQVGCNFEDVGSTDDCFLEIADI